MGNGYWGDAMVHQENCRELLSSLSEYVDGTLGEELCTELEHHLSGCENCQVVIDTLKRTIYLYKVSTASPELPDDVRQRLYHRLDLAEFLSM
jgi:anti-sigma factor (TIGR02949 family)